MNKTWKMLLLGSACACVVPGVAAAATYAGDPGFWAGPYVGGQVGLNDADADGLSSEVSFTISPHAGYNIAVPLNGLASPLIVGADAFAEFNDKTRHDFNHGPGHTRFGSNVYGIDVLAGLPVGTQHRIMPYAKLGFGTLNGTGDADNSETSVRFGLGAEYELYPNWGLTAEWMHQNADHITNNNFTVGVNYHFRGY